MQIKPTINFEFINESHWHEITTLLPTFHLNQFWSSIKSIQHFTQYCRHFNNFPWYWHECNIWSSKNPFFYNTTCATFATNLCALAFNIYNWNFAIILYQYGSLPGSNFINFLATNGDFPRMILERRLISQNHLRTIIFGKMVENIVDTKPFKNDISDMRHSRDIRPIAPIAPTLCSCTRLTYCWSENFFDF